MNEADKQAFEEWRRIGGYIRPPSCDAATAWGAACEYKNKQAAQVEPVQSAVAQPAVAVNEQLYKALRHLYYNAKNSGAEMGVALDVAEDAIAAAEAAKGGV